VVVAHLAARRAAMVVLVAADRALHLRIAAAQRLARLSLGSLPTAMLAGRAELQEFRQLVAAAVLDKLVPTVTTQTAALAAMVSQSPSLDRASTTAVVAAVAMKMAQG
jgi:hypothetical protein